MQRVSHRHAIMLGSVGQRCLVGVSAVALAAFWVPATAQAQSPQQLPDIYIAGGQGGAAPASNQGSSGDGGAGGAGAGGDGAGGPNAEGRDVNISRDEIERSGATNAQTLFAGETAVRAGGTMPSSTKVYVNGIEETNLNVQVDGARQPQRSGFHHNNNFVVDPEILAGVAVDAGVTAADVGPHALGGSLRYRTVDPFDLLKPGQTLGAFVKLSHDFNSETFSRSGAVYGQKNGFEALFYGKWADGDNYEDGDGNEVIGTDVDLQDYLGKFAFESPTGHRFAFSGQKTGDEGIRPFRNNYAASFIPDQFSFQEIERQTYTFKYTNTRPTAYFNPEVSFYYNKNSWNRPHPDDPSPFPFPLTCDPGVVSFFCVAYGDAQIESIGGKAQNTFEAGPGKLTVGGDFYREESEADHKGGSQILGERGRDIGIFAQYRAEFFDRLDISVGSRYDWHEFEGADGQSFDTSGASPNISADLEIIKGLTATASYGRSFGGIPLSEVILIRNDNAPFFGAGPFRIIPKYSATLEEQFGEQVRAGLSYERSGFRAEGYYFHTTIHDAIESSADTQDQVIENFGDVVTEGYNFAVSYTAANAKIAAKFQHTETEIGGDPISTASWYYGTPQGDILTLSGHYRFAEYGVLLGFVSQWAFDYDGSADVIAGSGGDARALGVLEGYDVHNVYAEWNPTFAESLTLRLDVLNVFDQQYVDRASALVPGNDPLYSPGRTVIASGKLTY